MKKSKRTECEKPINTLRINKRMEKQSITHPEYMAFLEPYMEKLDQKKFELLKQQRPECLPEEASIDPSVYSNFNGILKDRMCCLYKFTNSMDIGAGPFSNPLLLENDEDLLQSSASGFFKHEDVLTHFSVPEQHDFEKLYYKQVKINNKNRQQITQMIPERIKAEAYFELFNEIHTEIEETVKKQVQRKKRKVCQQENELIAEYIRRINEFHEVFGDAEQFPDDYYAFADMLSAEENEDLNIPFLKVLP
ncbi:hypothetical protein ENBRE01_0480 [Enteropsectra breve]|nr:hypothetical protein ENBRE01_0480 [Enteropsectra breve]